jgi:hypothetical protein
MRGNEALRDRDAWPILAAMRYPSIAALLSARAPLSGPVAVIMAEDAADVRPTLDWHLDAGFRTLVLLAPPALAGDDTRVLRVDADPHADDALVTAVNALIDAVEGQWIYYGYNTEYLFHPFRETRNIRELIAFHAGERRDAALACVVDLYAGDLTVAPDAVSRGDAHLDRTGYYALARKDEARGWAAKERQLDYFGGLRWRFEEHVPWARRRIDRVALFRARRGLRLRPDFTFTDEEYNTYACPWHHNITLAVASFRAAKALRTNPGSRERIATFQWRNSAPFAWHSQQLMDLGLMEPGQWF